MPDEPPGFPGLRIPISQKIGGDFFGFAFFFGHNGVADINVVLDIEARIPVILQGGHHLILGRIRCV